MSMDDTQKFCEKCGQNNEMSAKFCASCGTGFEGFDAIEETTVLRPEDAYAGCVVEPEVTRNPQYPQGQNPYSPPQTPPAGAYIPNQPMQQYGQPPYTSANLQGMFSEEQFYDQVASKKPKNWVKAIAIICIISGAIGIVPLALGNFISLIDIAFYITFGVLMLKKRNWIFPLLVTCYSGFFSVITLVLAGTPTGIVALICGIFATIALKKVHNAYGVYKASGQFPPAQI